MRKWHITAIWAAFVAVLMVFVSACGGSEEPIGNGYYDSLTYGEKKEACYAYVIFGNDLLTMESDIPEDILLERFNDLKENCE